MPLDDGMRRADAAAEDELNQILDSIRTETST